MAYAYNPQSLGDSATAAKYNDLAAAVGRVTDVGLYPAVADTYMVFKVSSVYYARSGLTGQIHASSGSSLSTLLQALIDGNTSSTISIAFKSGSTYTLASALTTTSTGVILRSDGGAVDAKLDYDGAGTAFTHNSGRDLIVENLYCDGGNPFFDFTDGVGSGYTFRFDNIKFWTACVQALKTGESNPFFWISHCHFRCTDQAVEIEKDSDIALWPQNYFFGTAGMSRQILVHSQAANVHIMKNTFVGCNDAVPEIEIAMVGGEDTANINVCQNKFGSEQLAAPSQRILVSYSGTGDARLKTSSFDDNYISIGTGGTAAPTFLKFPDDVGLQWCRVCGNRIYSGPDTGYLVHGGNNALSEKNLCAGNTGGASMFLLPVYGTDATALQGFKVRNNTFHVNENNLLSGTFAIDSTGLKTVTVAHGCDYTPSPEDVQATIVEDTDVDDWWAMVTKVKDIGATNLSVDVYVLDASATGSATAKLSIRICDN